MIASNDALRTALSKMVATLTESQPLAASDLTSVTVPVDAAVIAPSSDITVAACHRLIQDEGARVLVIDAFATPSDRLRYRRVGAEWLPMEVSDVTQQMLMKFLGTGLVD